jgi:hypothetical protein
MIETDYFILNGEQYQEFYTEAQQLGITLDHFLLEWCDVQGPMVIVDK